MNTKKTLVKANALIKRINRKLAPMECQLRTARTVNTELSVGKYFVVDVQQNFIFRKYVDLEREGVRLGVLRPNEVLAA